MFIKEAEFGKSADGGYLLCSVASSAACWQIYVTYVCLYFYSIYIYTHTNTHIYTSCVYIYIYIYIYIFICILFF